MKNKQHKQYVVAKVNPFGPSKREAGSDVSILELLDIENDFQHCFSYISDSNFNFAQWQKIYNEDFDANAFVIEGFFASKGKEHNAKDYQGSELINADAKFQIKERADRQQLLYLIAQKLGLL